MAIGEDVYSELSSDAGLTALVSTRIYPTWLPQNATMPAISYTQISERVQQTIEGEVALRNHMYQFDIWSNTYSGAQTIATALLTAMAAASLFKSYRLGQTETYEPEIDIHRISVDFSIWQ